MDNALVLQAARFGDLIQTGRLLTSLGRNYAVHLCADVSLESLVPLVYPEIAYHPVDFHRPDLMGLKNLRNFEILKNTGFAKIYNCNFSPFTAAISRMFPDDRLINYRPADHSEGGLYKSPWVRLGSRLAAIRSITPLNLVDFWAWSEADPVSGASVNPVAKNGGGGLGIVMAGREARRSLPPEILATIISITVQILKPGRIKLFGTARESRLAHKLIRSLAPALASKIVDLCGKTDYKSLVSEIAGLDLLLSPDTGTMHLASRLGVPVMAFFLSSAWCHETGPYGSGHIVWQSFAPCSPCLENADCPYNLRCLEPFADKKFFRCLGDVLSHGRTISAMPEGLCCYGTDFDELGIKFVPIAGEDPGGGKRGELRHMLKEWLGIASSKANFNLTEFNKNVYRELFPIDEWMLPPERYY